MSIRNISENNKQKTKCSALKKELAFFLYLKKEVQRWSVTTLFQWLNSTGANGFTVLLDFALFCRVSVSSPDIAFLFQAGRSRKVKSISVHSILSGKQIFSPNSSSFCQPNYNKWPVLAIMQNLKMNSRVKGGNE